jgi:regulator of sigma E protease
MDDILFKIAAFIVAIGTLVAVHEFGHFWVARRLGVKVLRFSIGFGRPLWRKVAADGTEYVVAAIPLGGYVKMLDEREGEVPAEQRHRAFNTQSLATRSAVVVAGPAFNLIFAVAAFWLMLVLGESGLRPIIGAIDPDTPADRAGFVAGDEILAVNGRQTPVWFNVVEQLAAASVSDGRITIQVRDPDGMEQLRSLPDGAVGDLAERDDLFGDLGIEPFRPRLPAVIGRVLPGEPAEAAGVRAGDRVVMADGEPIADWSAWVDYVQARAGKVIRVEVMRDAERVLLDLIPATHESDDGPIGRIGAEADRPDDFFKPYQAVSRLGPLEAVPEAISRTWEYSVLTLKVMGRILTGQASVKNLSGPITIADAAGRTASIGLVQFVKFLAIVSISLGVLNLLPIPVLDGGHLLFFLFEAIKGSPVSDELMMQGQRIGLAILLSLMAVAFYVDLSRLFD